MPEVIKNLLGSRKDLFAFIIVIAVSVALFIGRIDRDFWWTVVQWVGGAWLLVRGAEDALVKAAAVKRGAEPKGTAADP